MAVSDKEAAARIKAAIEEGIKNGSIIIEPAKPAKPATPAKPETSTPKEPKDMPKNEKF